MRKELKIEISVRNNDGDLLGTTDALGWESAEEALGKLERMVEMKKNCPTCGYCSGNCDNCDWCGTSPDTEYVRKKDKTQF